MTLRRMLLALYSLVFIAACGGLIALTWNEDQKLDIDLADGDFNMQAFITADDTWQVIATVALGLLILFGLWTLLMALLPAATGSTGMLRLKQADGGTVEVTSQALERLVRDEVEALPEVRQVIPRVRVSGGAVDTDALVVIEQQASIAHVTTVVNDAINRAFKEQVGVTNVKRPNIRISYDTVKGRPVSEGAVRRMDPARPVSPPTPGEQEAAVAWPAPPPDVVRPEPEQPAEAPNGWPSDREQADGKPREPAENQEQQ